MDEFLLAVVDDAEQLLDDCIEAVLVLLDQGLEIFGGLVQSVFDEAGSAVGIVGLAVDVEVVDDGLDLVLDLGGAALLAVVAAAIVLGLAIASLLVEEAVAVGVLDGFALALGLAFLDGLGWKVVSIRLL